MSICYVCADSIRFNDAGLSVSQDLKLEEYLRSSRYLQCFYPDLDGSGGREESNDEQWGLICSQCRTPAFCDLVFICFLSRKWSNVFIKLT